MFISDEDFDKKKQIILIVKKIKIKLFYSEQHFEILSKNTTFGLLKLSVCAR